ncbi:extracellular solute-binding protein [Paraburkholderia tropica]|uniref:ABC transporter substrate-binding protein n=1 Tax=Paraburkholderia tropica TaxID=92647 RepID=UPI0030174E75
MTKQRNTITIQLRLLIGLSIATACMVAGCGKSSEISPTSTQAADTGTRAPDRSTAQAQDTVPGASSSQQPKELRDLYQQAQAAHEDEVVLYTAFSVGFDDIWNAFAHDFPGIRVRSSQLAGAQLLTRLTSEALSGNHKGDLVLTGYSDTAQLAADGRLAVDVPGTTRDLDSRYKDPAGTYQIPFSNVFALVYNTSQVKPGEVPKTMDDVLLPQWRQRFGLPKLTGLSLTDVAIASLSFHHEITEAQLQHLASNAQQIDSTGMLSYPAEGRLAFTIWVPAHSAWRMQHAGAPIGIAFPKNLTYVLSPGIGLVQDAPHAHAARLLKAWLFTPRAQALLVEKTHSYGTMPGAPTPVGFPALAELGRTDLPLDQTNAILKQSRIRTLALFGQE